VVRVDGQGGVRARSPVTRPESADSELGTRNKSDYRIVSEVQAQLIGGWVSKKMVRIPARGSNYLTCVNEGSDAWSGGFT
jgi:hypothetical protein